MSAGGFDPSSRGPVPLHSDSSGAVYDRYHDDLNSSYYEEPIARNYGIGRSYRTTLVDHLALDFLFAAVGGFFRLLSRFFGSLFTSTPEPWQSQGRGFSGVGRVGGGNVTQLRELQHRDAAWNEQALLSGASQAFLRMQEAWTKSDLATLQRTLMPALFQQWRQKLEEDRLRCVRNFVSETKILSAKIFDFEDYADNDQDRFSVTFVAQSWDRVVTFSGNVVLESRAPFAQTWSFRRQGREFRLESVVNVEFQARRAA